MDAWRLGDTRFTPRAQFSVSHTRMDACTETGGGFPATFDERSHTAKELRIGVRADKHLTERTTLHGDVEAVHRFDDSTKGASGQIIGLFNFNLADTAIEQDWLRVGVELDHRLSQQHTLSASLHASSEGEDPSVSGAVSLKMAF